EAITIPVPRDPSRILADVHAYIDPKRDPDDLLGETLKRDDWRPPGLAGGKAEEDRSEEQTATLKLDRQILREAAGMMEGFDLAATPLDVSLDESDALDNAPTRKPPPGTTSP